jgi:hypothetical protein
MGENSQEMTKKGNGDHSQRNFSVLQEIPPFKINGMPTKEYQFSLAKPWIKDLDPTTKLKMIATKGQIFQLLGVKSFSEIQNIIKDDKLREETSKKAYALLGKMYGISGNEKEIASRIVNFAGRADFVIEYLNKNIFALSDSPVEFEMINEVRNTTNPTDLLLMIFDERYSTRAKFEAKRKLVLMNLAGSIEQREKETNNEEKFKKFMKFLDEHVLDKNTKIGELESVFVLSKHKNDNFEVESYEILTKKEKEKRDRDGIKREKGQKLTELNWRKFTLDGKQIPMQYSTREKGREKKILKLLRKGIENPAVAVEDDLGIMAVFRSKKDINSFQMRLIQGATDYGSYMSFEQIEDSLENGNYSAKNVGSNSELRQRNFYINTDGGVRIDAITHTIKTYLDFLYKDGVSHNEYEVKRLFDTSVVELLFPKSVYDTNWKEIEPKIIQTVRNNNRK